VEPTLRALFQFFIFAAVVGVVGCATYQQLRLDRRHGEAHVRDREVASLPAGAIDYHSQVRPILEARCVVCHACYDAPCQLKLGSSEGIDRGADPDKVYDSKRLVQADLTRLFEDAQTTKDWRKKNFHPVLNERAQSRKANREAGLLHRLLQLKRAHPVKAGTLLTDDIDLGLRHEEKCPTIEQFGRHARKHPQWGMPYGLPGLTAAEHDIVTRWLEEGALHVRPPALPQRFADHIARWESFLNEDSLEARLASRYIYEHLFLAHVYFENGESGAPPRFFELVRSKTPPGEPIDRIATRRPYDDPGVARPWYRLQPVREAIVAKLHLPYRLDEDRMQRWNELFRRADYRVEKLPSYSPKVASNPFISFRALPADSRYRFMLDEAEFTLMGFIKGAVCRGPIALNVIDDQFWVFFVDPDTKSKLQDAEFLYEHAESLRMPAESSSNARPLATWLHRSKDEKKWVRAKQHALREELAADAKITLDLLWDGEGKNRNAALTVFRHYDSASVVKGMVGSPPKTAWVIGYPLLERIHYLLVAGFDVYGNIGHQLSTRAYMDFLRMESEFTFLALLPMEARKTERELWYRDTDERMYREIVDELADLDVETGIRYETDHPKLELYRMLWSRFANVREDRYGLDDPQLPKDVVAPLRELAALTGTKLERVPQTAFLYVPDAPAGAQVFTLIRNDGHTNIASPFDEKARRLPRENTLTVARGFIGTYPNAFYVVERERLPELVARITALRTESDYAALQLEFGVRRTDPDFWPTSDRLAEISRRRWPIEAGLFDLARYENR
jgi:hypothetical protein